MSQLLACGDTLGNDKSPLLLQKVKLYNSLLKNKYITVCKTDS